MKCPYCGEDMIRGYIQCRDGLHWTPKKFPVAALSVFSQGSISLANGAAENNRTIFAHHCGRCKKILIDYADEQS